MLLSGGWSYQGNVFNYITFWKLASCSLPLNLLFTDEQDPRGNKQDPRVSISTGQEAHACVYPRPNATPLTDFRKYRI